MKINFRIIIVTLLSSLSFLTVHAQTDDMDADFIEAVKKYLKAAPNSLGNQKEQLLKVFTELNKSIAPELDDDNSQQYVEEYLGEQFVSDVAERLLAKGLNGLVSTDDLKKLTEALQSPEGKDLQQKATKMNSITSAAWEDFGKMVVMQLMSGKTPEPLEQNSEIPESYTTLFKQYYAKSGLGSLSSNMMQGLTARWRSSTNTSAQTCPHFISIRCITSWTKATCALPLNWPICLHIKTWWMHRAT